MSFVQVIDLSFNADHVEQLHSTDSENQFLFEP